MRTRAFVTAALLALDLHLVGATPVATSTGPTCGHLAATGFGPVAACNTVASFGGHVDFSENVSGISCLRGPNAHGDLVGHAVSYSGSSVSSDGSGTFTFFGGPQVATPFGPVSYGEQRWPATIYGPLLRWGNFNFLSGRFYPSGSWLPDVGATSCPKPAPPFDYPDFLPDAFFGEVMNFPLGVTNQNMGVVRLNTFIAVPKSCKSVIGIDVCGEGDNRGFDPYSYASDSRIAVELDFITGTGRIFANQSCIVDPGNACLPPRPLRQVDPNGSAFLDQNYNNFWWGAFAITNSEDIDMELTFHATNAFAPENPLIIPLPWPHVCSIDRSFYLHWNSSNYTLSLSGVNGDPFPSDEAYWYHGLARVASPVHTLRQHSESGGLGALCDVNG